MQPDSGRRDITRKGVAVGSVWERRMKMDELNGGIKVFNGGGDSCDDEERVPVYRRLRRNQSDGGAEKRKRRSWRQPEMGAVNHTPVKLRKARSAGIGPQMEVGENGVLLITDGKENQEEDDDIKIDMEEHGRCFDDKQIDMPAEKDKEGEEKEAPAPREIDLKDKEQDPSKPCEDVVLPDLKLFVDKPANQNRMQHIVDLVMWRDVSKTALFFGFGTFLLLSSSYAGEISFSMISAISYMGLLYLAVIFLLRSFLRRAEETVFQPEEAHEDRLIGEEEAIWIVRRILPYLNELLSRIRSLFSGDPATTMKMAVILFVMAKCGSSLTVSSLAKIGFFGAFTIPKILSAYSAQMARSGKYWLARFRDGWDSCTHKKAVAAAIFTVIWNLSSTVARIWSVFMLVVAIRLYQQCLVAEGDEEMTINEEVELQHQQQQQQQKDAKSILSHRDQERPLGYTRVIRDKKVKKVA